MADIHPFKISVPQSAQETLQQKLALATFPDELTDSDWDYGTPLADIKRLVNYWRTNYDWQIHEDKLNELPQFKTHVSVDDYGELDIHFVHQRSHVENAIPLLFVHGWPGTFHEFEKLLPLLAERKEGEPAFHIVAPSLPNFGFSQAVKQKGFAVPQYAETCHKLMLKLGYDQYVTQAGDWGWWITRTMGRLYPKSCKASHLNMIVPSQPTITKSPLLALQHAITPYSEKEKKGLDRSKWFKSSGYGYNLIQSTKPQTLGYSLADSPVGLLAWIYEKLHDWTDSYPFTDDEILTWISIYLFSTPGPTASLRIYYEATHEKDRFSTHAAMNWIGDVKLGLAHFPRDLYVLPKIWARGLGNVVFESDNEKGGHFAAFEQPQAVAKDLKSMFGRGGGAFGVVDGRTGYEA